MPRFSFENKRLHYTQAVEHIRKSDCQDLIRLALQEDAPEGDPSSEAIFSAKAQGRAQLNAKEGGLLCGLVLIPYLLEIAVEQGLAPLNWHSSYKDGDTFTEGATLAYCSGSIRSLLRLERIILNFLQYLSGISTHVYRNIQELQRRNIQICLLDTRKTLPGWRKLSKYAVYCGGASNHRLNLSDMLLIKDNHIQAAGDIKKAIELAKQAFPQLLLEVEIRDLSELKSACDAGVDFIMLDNMGVPEILEAKEWLCRYYRKNRSQAPRIEISGAWKLDRLAELPEHTDWSGVGLSMGSLTYGARFLDISMQVQAS